MLLDVAYNKGFRLSYIPDKKHADLCMTHNQGVMFYDRLEEIAQQIAKKWIHGSHSVGVIRQDNYFNAVGDFAEVDRRSPEEDREMPVSCIMFVNALVEDLESTVKSFGLPFDREQVEKG